MRANECRPRSLLCVDAQNVLLHKRYRKRYKADRWLLIIIFYSERANLESRGHCGDSSNLHLAPQSLLRIHFLRAFALNTLAPLLFDSLWHRGRPNYKICLHA